MKLRGKVWNIAYYRSTDGTVWALYWNGKHWAQVGLGGAANVAGHLSVDSGWHFVYYQGSDDRMWVYHYTGTRWLQAQLSITANVGGALTADTGGIVYYASSVDQSAWATYWTGKVWAQRSLGVTPILTDSAALYAHLTPLVIDTSGRCQAVHFSGTAWNSAILEPGGTDLSSGLSAIPSARLIFAIRNDGSVAAFIP